MRYLRKSKVGYIACMHVKYQFLQTKWVEMEAKTVFWTIIFEYFVCIFQQMSKIEFWKYSLPRQLFHQKMGTKTTIYQMFIHNWSFGHNFRCDRGSYLAEKAFNFLTFNVKHPVYQNLLTVHVGYIPVHAGYINSKSGPLVRSK